MLITHDLGVIAEMADYVVVMYAGRIVEKGTVHDIFKNPSHPYTIGLMNSKPVVGKKIDELYCIPGSVPNPIAMPNYCYFRDRCEMRTEHCDGEYPPVIQLSETHQCSCYRDLLIYLDEEERGVTAMSERENTAVEQQDETLLEVRDLKKYFPIKGGLFNKVVGQVRAVDGISFKLKRGTTMGLVGESGCGKSTACLHDPPPPRADLRRDPVQWHRYRLPL